MRVDVFTYPGVAHDEMERAGVRAICEYFATALPAGLIPMDPMSPPKAVNAFPIATDLAVPS